MEKNTIVTKHEDTLKMGKKGLLNFIFGRTGILIILILIQIGVLLLGFNVIRTYMMAAYEAFVLMGFFLVVFIINKKGNPAFKIAWLIPILTVPVFGALFYLYFHLQIETRALNQAIAKEMDATEKLVGQKGEAYRKLKEENMQVARLAKYIRKASGSAVHENTAARYFPSGEDAFNLILEEMSKAEKFIFLEFFIINQGYMWDSVLEILKAKVKEGVQVRVLYDGMSDYFSLPKHYPDYIRSMGIECQVYSPIVPLLSTVQNNRDHRKMLVIDGHTAFTGGINLADEYINQKERFGYWKDCCIMLKGDAVQDFTLMFLQMWNVVEYHAVYRRKGLKKRVPDRSVYHDYINIPIPKQEGENLGFVIGYDDNPLDDEQTGEMVYTDILFTAKQYVHICTPYLALDHEMVQAFTYAAKRGVDVKIILPHIPDKKYAFYVAKTYYKELIEAGVKIYEFLPGFIHSKMYISDDEKAVVGSINTDFRSLYLSFECAAFLYKNEEILQIEADFQETLKQCEKMTEKAYDDLPLHAKVAGSVLRLFAPLI